MQTHKQLTLALSPKISWAVCLKLMRSGTVCTTMVTNSSTFPYCLTFFCRTTCQMYEYVSCRGDAIRRREAKGRAPENEFENITLHNVALTVLLWGQYLKKKKSSPASTPTNLAQIRPVSVIANWRVLVIEKLQTLCHLWGCAIAACRGRCSASGRLLKAAEKPQRVWKSARLRVRVQ